MSATIKHRATTTSTGRGMRVWPVWTPLWRVREALGGWAFHLGALAALHIVTGGAYGLLVHLNAARGVTVWDPGIALDTTLPVLPWTIVPYATYFLYGPLSALATRRTDRGRRELLLFYQVLVGMNLIGFTIYVLIPCEIQIVQDVPRVVLEGDGVVGTLFRFVRSLDRPYNAWPSMHASMSLAIALYAARAWKRPWARLLLALAWGLLALSILTTKQHYLFDLVTGALLGWGAWRWFLRRALPSTDANSTAGVCH